MNQTTRTPTTKRQANCLSSDKTRELLKIRYRSHMNMMVAHRSPRIKPLFGIVQLHVTRRMQQHTEALEAINVLVRNLASTYG